MISRVRTLAVGGAATLFVAVYVLTSGMTTASAQSASAEWAFAPRGVFVDERVVQSMRLQMDTDAAATAGGVSLGYLNGAELFAPSEDALILLMAAGLLGHEETQVTGVMVVRACRVWSDPEAPNATDLTAVAEVLATELHRIWGDLGVPFPPCEVTTDPTAADLLIFPAGQPPAGVDFLAFNTEGSFLGYQPFPGPGSGGGTGGGDAGGPLPAVTGALGPSQDGATTTQIALLSAIALGIAAWARRATRHEG